jgi:hypothetical protein
MLKVSFKNPENVSEFLFASEETSISFLNQLSSFFTAILKTIITFLLLRTKSKKCWGIKIV